MATNTAQPYFGGNALQQYDEYKKVEVIDGVYRGYIKKNCDASPFAYWYYCQRADDESSIITWWIYRGIEEWFISRLTPVKYFL
jgi:hypothetical protein